MDWNFELLSPLSLTVVGVLGGALLGALLVARLATGPPADLARRSGLLVLRGLVLLLLVLLLANPVQVTETPGASERSDVFFLLDTSESMKSVSGQGSRWDQAVGIIRDADEEVRDELAADVKLFRFGNRLNSIEDVRPLLAAASGPSGTRPASAGAGAPLVPGDTDTRLQAALRQITSRFGRSPPSALVVFSDGRARDSAGVIEIARHFASLDVPIHVAPVGDLSKTGDVAIVAAVVPESVRRHSQVEVQVFLRSYGFDGQRIEVQLSAVDDQGNLLRSLATPQPISLKSGFQSQSLSFRADKDARRLMIHVPVQEGEEATANNTIYAGTRIDQTKIRVLYVEGKRELPQPVRRGEAFVIRGPYSQLQQALAADDAIECVVVSGAYGDLRQVNSNGYLDETRGFPQTSAELSAYDALILSNVASGMFTDEQLGWVERWVGERGAGLCMLGGPNSFGSGGWDETTVAKILPVTIGGRNDWDPGAVVQGKVDMPPTPHPIWQLVSDAKQNRAIVEKFPAFDGANRSLALKPALADVLVTAAADSAPSGFSFGSLFGLQERPLPGGAGPLPVLAISPYGKGRAMSLATAVTEPWARSFVNDWGEGDSRYYDKFWRNVIYWLTGDSTIGRRRLVASRDKLYYKPGETIELRATAYDEGADKTRDYRVVAMIEPKSATLDPEDLYSPVRWPDGITREEGMEGPLVMWGEEFEVPLLGASAAGALGGEHGYGIQLKINDVLKGRSANEGLRIELTALEDQTQVDSTSLEIQILYDPFEYQNPFPDHELLQQVAAISGGEVLHNGAELADMIRDVEVSQGPPVVSKSPLWSNWWIWTAIIGLLTIEWLWRRQAGLA